ncbi:MAG: hypothetical protein JNK46_04905 [Methylobacteriaceae bacterium]|nr:hypothetical protein [Methylobacteriaceae bacterium]
MRQAMIQTSEPRAAVAEIDRRALIARLAGRARITDFDVAALRRLIEDTGSVTREEADCLYAIEAAPSDKPEAWTGFLIETITDHIVWQSRPTGVVSETQAEWLIAQADRCDSLAGLGALASVAAEAHRVPLWFVAAVRARAARRFGAPAADGRAA